MKICPAGAELFPGDGRTDGEADRTDMTKLTAAFSNLANPSKNNSPFY